MAVGTLRELGFVNLSRYTFKTQTHTSHQSQTAQYLESLPISTTSVVVSKSESSFAPVLKAELERLTIQSGVYLAISVNQIDVEELYWLPLLKRGHCAFQLQARVTQGNAVRDTMISGEMEFAVNGRCSIRTFKQVLAKKIVQESMEYIDQ